MLRESARFGAICDRNLPSFSPNRRCGPIIASVLPSRLGMFTALRMVPSSSTARMDCAISMPTLSCASAVDAPRCGVRTRLEAPRNGEPAQLAADPAHSDNAKRFVVELDAFEILFVPFLPANVCVCLRNLARHREQQ